MITAPIMQVEFIQLSKVCLRDCLELNLVVNIESLITFTVPFNLIILNELKLKNFNVLYLKIRIEN